MTYGVQIVEHCSVWVAVTCVQLSQGDGTEEVVACSWDGQTYFVNLSKDVVRFHFRENVAAFCAGK